MPLDHHDLATTATKRRTRLTGNFASKINALAGFHMPATFRRIDAAARSGARSDRSPGFAARCSGGTRSNPCPTEKSAQRHPSPWVAFGEGVRPKRQSERGRSLMVDARSPTLEPGCPVGGVVPLCSENLGTEAPNPLGPMGAVIRRHPRKRMNDCPHKPTQKSGETSRGHADSRAMRR